MEPLHVISIQKQCNEDWQLYTAGKRVQGYQRYT